MKILRIMSSMAIATVAALTFIAQAASVDVTTARMEANNFVKSKMASKGMFNAPATADLKLAHTEASSVEGNAYYVFNIQGGGWVIIAGDDRAKQVLAYGDKGNIDMNNLPDNMKGFLNMLKGQIETAVEPLLKTDWGQSEPMNRLCPLNGSGKITSVGCGPLAMAQIMYYWKYPNEVAAVPGYSISWSQYMSELPATTFDYSLMLDNYYTHNPETGNPTGYVAFTEEQANEVAKLCRYCGQACKARYGNANETSTGSYTYDQRDAFLRFGFNENMQLIGKDPSYYCSNSNKYSIEEWCDLINIELQAGRPIPYHDLYEGHAWVLDGVDADGKFHMNWGFNGRFNGWFEINALVFHPYGDDEVWDFSQGSNGGNEMIIGMYPYDDYVIPGDEPTVMVGDVNKDKAVNIADVTALIDYLLSQDATGIDLEAANCNQDDAVNISDVTKLIDYLLSQTW